MEQDYQFDEGSTATLTCTATGAPAVVFHWQFEGNNISDLLATVTNLFGVSSNLIFTTSRLTYDSISRTSTGIHTCIGSNGIGPNDELDSNVTVSCKCHMIVCVYINTL